MRISVIIPVLNEETVIGACLAQFCGVEGVELIVVDGGSTDGTQQVVEARGGVQWVQVEKAGRARQMNAGAERATGDVFLFLHADTFLPSDGLRLIRDSLRVPGVVGRAISARLVGEDDSFSAGRVFEHFALPVFGDYLWRSGYLCSARDVWRCEGIPSLAIV